VNAEAALRLALVPAAVWLASLAARRWGHSVSGYLGGMPLIGGPITYFLAIDYGPEFAARSASITLAVVLAQAAHLLAFAHIARRSGWPWALAGGWASFGALAVAIGWIAPPAWIGLLLAAAGLAFAWRFLPWPREHARLPSVPAMELYLRLAAAFALALAIVLGAKALGPVWSGALLSMPVTGSITPPFTAARYGPDAVARLTRGFVVGLTGFGSFFFVVAAGCVALGSTSAFLLAVVAALVAIALSSRMLTIRARP
jgi:hypothetical protein